MKNRSKVVTYMEILAALAEKPRLPTKLAQICNVNYQRLEEFLTPLEAKEYLKREIIDGHEVIAITSEGLKINHLWQELRVKFPT